MSLFLRSRRVVARGALQDCVIRIDEGRITSLLSPAEVAANDVQDYGDLVIAPGIVDPHVHINEPGRTDWEGFETATRAAAAGGVTTIVDMPLNSSPVTTTLAAFEEKVAAAEGKLYADCGFHGGVVPANAETLSPLLSCGILGIKAFLIHSGIDEFPKVDERDLRTALPALASSGLPLLVHAEVAGASAASPASTQRYAEYLNSRPRAWEDDAIALMIRLAKEFNCRVHIVHLSSSGSIEQLRDAKQRGVPISVETCPHYLYFSSEEIPEGATEFKCAPPIREHENNILLWQALRDGVIDFIASDHSPCPPHLKHRESGDFMNAWGGIASLQVTLPVTWTAARQYGMRIEELSRLMSEAPARLIGLHNRKGRIEPGYDADFVVWNPEETFVVTPDLILHRHKITPYIGEKVAGRVHATFLRGQMIFDGAHVSGPFGNVLRRNSF